MPQRTPHRVVIAGGGVAGLEALTALHSLAAHRVAITLLAPDDEFTIRALTVQEPFARPAPRHYGIDEICRAHDAEHVRDTLEAVDAERRTVTTGSGEQLVYDSLLVATGARPVPVFERATSFRGEQDAEGVHGIIQDVEGGYSTRIAFVVPTGVTWPLPLYELALMLAERASSVGMDIQLTLVTPEHRPLELFGDAASGAVDEVLSMANVVTVTGAQADDVDHGKVLDADGRTIVHAQRVIALPRLTAIRTEGLPADDEGFIPIDEQGRVRGLQDVYAAGDGTTFPVKQGGIAAQQADVAAREIADHAGAPILPQPFRPVLRAKLLTGSRATYLRQALSGEAGEGSSAAEHSLWWPPTKVAAPYLAPYLAQVDEERSGAPKR